MLEEVEGDDQLMRPIGPGDYQINRTLDIRDVNISWPQQMVVEIDVMAPPGTPMKVLYWIPMANPEQEAFDKIMDGGQQPEMVGG